MTYSLCKRVIAIQIERKTLNKDEMQAKLDAFLLANRLTKEEYTELAAAVEAA